jgi:hypothetical protein
MATERHGYNRSPITDYSSIITVLAQEWDAVWVLVWIAAWAWALA